MNKLRLSLLATGLSVMQAEMEAGKAKPDVFYMMAWRRCGSKELNPATEGFNCGFAGCAIGWAGKFIPDFPFTHVKNGCGGFQLSLDGELPLTDDYYELGYYFGITDKEARQLFDPFTYECPNNIGPIDVVIEINKLLTQGDLS